MKKQIQVAGAYQYDGKTGTFTGTVVFDEREDCIYYTWNLRDEDGNNLAGRSAPVAFQQIPTGQDKIEFSKAHALEGIRKYRMGGEKIIQELRLLD